MLFVAVVAMVGVTAAFVAPRSEVQRPVRAEEVASEVVSIPVLGEDVAAVIVGRGRIGGLLSSAGDAIMTRESGWPADAPSTGPIYVCTRNDALDAVIDATPEDRREDLVFLQNGMLGPYLESKGLADCTQGLVYFAVSKLGESPTDGITDLNPDGLTTATGKWAEAFRARLAKAGLRCRVAEGDDFVRAMLEKHVWISAFMLVGAANGGVTVGDVEQHHRQQLGELVEELVLAGQTALGVQLQPGYLDRLCAYARAVKHFPTAVKEFPWRNGWFYKLSLDAAAQGRDDPLRLHTALLYEIPTRLQTRLLASLPSLPASREGAPLSLHTNYQSSSLPPSLPPSRERERERETATATRKRRVEPFSAPVSPRRPPSLELYEGDLGRTSCLETRG